MALEADWLGSIFSGSCITNGSDVVAFYTSAGMSQTQSMAVSKDNGRTFKKYEGNPVITSDKPDFRDPNVFWYEPTKRWVMILAVGQEMQLYSSADLKAWKYESSFGQEYGNPSGVWECPDLFELEVRSEELGVNSNLNSQTSNLKSKKWVLIVSVNPGGPLVGSGTMYFTGQFDGTTFTADEGDYPLWLDYGMDNYAGVTWSNTGDRHIMIGWMNNWSYSGAVPCSPWRSAMTLPRELSLTEYEGKPLLCSTVVKEIDGIAGQWQNAGATFDAGKAYQLRLTVALDRSTTVTLSNDQGEQFSFDISGSARTLTAHRTGTSGMTSFNGTFSIPSMNAPLCVEGNSVTLDVFVDQSSVEIFTRQGTLSMTNLVFPSSIYNHLTVAGADCEAQFRQLNRIWK